MFAKKKKKGFTLIELLVVIAIIGILASIVLVSLSGARDRAKDARIIAELGQMRSTSEVFYGNQTTNSYTGLCADSYVIALQNDVCAQKGQAALCTGVHWNCRESALAPLVSDAYCVSSQLNGGAYWCVDSTLVSQQYSAAPACSATVFTCD